MNRDYITCVRRCFVNTVCFFMLLLSSLPLSGCARKITRTFFAADTVCTITLYEAKPAVLDGAVTLCNNLCNLLDCKSADSPLARLNQNGRLENADDALLEVMEQGLYYSRVSNGVFDITIGSLTALWDFKANTLPDPAACKAAAALVDYRNVSVAGKTISLQGGAKLDLGAIAKGFIAGKIENYLRENGINRALINLGGNVTVVGDNGGKPFSVGIQTPFEEGVLVAVEAQNTSVVTSGIYQRYIEKDGTLYHHLLSTETGLPVSNGLRSVTILSNNHTQADALSTLCFLLGQEKGGRLIEATEGAQAVFVDENNQLYLTSGLQIKGNRITKH